MLTLTRFMQLFTDSALDAVPQSTGVPVDIIAQGLSSFYAIPVRALPPRALPTLQSGGILFHTIAGDLRREGLSPDACCCIAIVSSATLSAKQAMFISEQVKPIDSSFLQS